MYTTTHEVIHNFNAYNIIMSNVHTLFHDHIYYRTQKFLVKPEWSCLETEFSTSNTDPFLLSVLEFQVCQLTSGLNRYNKLGQKSPWKTHTHYFSLLFVILTTLPFAYNIILPPPSPTHTLRYQTHAHSIHLTLVHSYPASITLPSE